MEITRVSHGDSFLFAVRQRLNLSVPLPAMPPGDTQPSAATMGDTQAMKMALGMLQSDL